MKRSGIVAILLIVGIFTSCGTHVLDSTVNYILSTMCSDSNWTIMDTKENLIDVKLSTVCAEDDLRSAVS